MIRHKMAVSLQRRPSFLPAVVNPGGRKRALLVHLVEPFADNRIDLRHQNRLQVLELARLIALRGYCVDALAPGGAVRPGMAPYDLVVDLHPGLSSYPKGGVLVGYITGASPAFSNCAEQSRLSALARRRGVLLKPRRQVREFSAENLGRCDAIFFIGSEANLATYRGFPLPPVHFIRNFAYPTPAITRQPDGSDGFLFLASGGQVHKGLDLLLDIFARHPEWTLHVCSSFHEEPDFCRAFLRELFHCRNIVPHGFLRLDSREFIACAGACRHAILPSCSEANAGSVLSAMAAGLIPVVSKECGFSADEVYYLPDCSTEAIEATIATRMAIDNCLLEAESARIRALVAARFSPDAFTGSVDAALAAVLPNEAADNRPK